MLPPGRTSCLKTMFHRYSKNEVVITNVVEKLLQDMGNKPNNMEESYGKQLQLTKYLLVLITICTKSSPVVCRSEKCSAATVILRSMQCKTPSCPSPCVYLSRKWQKSFTLIIMFPLVDHEGNKSHAILQIRQCKHTLILCE